MSKIRIICFLCLLVFTLNAQEKTKQLIYLEHSESLIFDKDIHPDYQVLTGDVRFRHDSAWMYCDTAHYYQSSNSLYAFGHVRIEQGDTLFIYGQSMFYDGNKKIAQLRKNVRMINKNVTLYTNYFDFDRNTNIGYYLHKGKIVDSTNTLSSSYGQYNAGTKMAFFKDNVVLDHPQFVMKTDTLNYHTETGVASIVSPTVITSESAVVHAFRGWYNTKTDKSLLLDRSYIVSSPYFMIGDSIFYEQLAGIGKGYNNVSLIDSSKSITLNADYAYYHQEKGYALLTDKALLKEYSGRDTLYLHADTLSTQKDSTYDTFRAYHHVRSYRIDLQAVCDSLFYSARDSILDINGSPIIWADNQMVRGAHMNLYIKNSMPDYLHVERNAITISQETSDSSLFNQSSGDDLKAYFINNKVRRIEVDGSAQSIYLPHDENEEIIGLNRLENGSVYMDMDEEGKMKRIKVAPQPKGKFYPLSLVTIEIKRLPLFSWPAELRPSGPMDVFRGTNKENNIYTEDSGRSEKSPESLQRNARRRDREKRQR